MYLCIPRSLPWSLWGNNYHFVRNTTPWLPPSPASWMFRAFGLLSERMLWSRRTNSEGDSRWRGPTGTEIFKHRGPDVLGPQFLEPLPISWRFWELYPKNIGSPKFENHHISDTIHYVRINRIFFFLKGPLLADVELVYNLLVPLVCLETNVSEEGKGEMLSSAEKTLRRVTFCWNWLDNLPLSIIM